MTTTVGVAEDDPQVRDLLVRALRDEGYEVLAASTGSQAIERFGGGRADLLILDIGLPDADGRDVCQALRSRGVPAPVLFLTAYDAVVDRVSGFQAGGDDYLTKPFAIAELVVRVAALIRRRRPQAPASATGHDIVLDPGDQAARYVDRSVQLTPTEYRLLGALLTADGIVARRHLVATGWHEGALVHDNTLDSFVGRLRRKLRAISDEHEIVTRRGSGYRLQRRVDS